VKANEQLRQWSENSGCTGIPVHTDNGIVDPWLVSHVMPASDLSMVQQ
jgi:hypothetical protein